MTDGAATRPREVPVSTTPGTAVRSLLPREHGAYGQITFPLVTAFAVAGLSTAGLLFAAAVVAGFLAHEPAAVLLGLRGARARRELHGPAVRWLVLCLAIAAAAGTATVLAIDPARRWSIAVPVAPALLLAALTARGRDKSSYGEIIAALAFAGAAVPICMAGGASATTAAAVAIPFALLFGASTLAVRVVILKVRGGGDLRAVAMTRRAAFSLAAGAAAALALAVAGERLPVSVLAAAGPGLLTAAAVAARPPSPSRLRSLGWALIAASVATAAIVIVAARSA
jgi:hypothetical protein